ncbi:MAG: molybdate ABC transporter substrate-binding protein, partial [Myxococcota bacterium]
AASLLLVIGCASTANQRGDVEQEIYVFAAASLTDAFQTVADEFEAEHPAIDIKFNFAGSQSLRTQIEQGAAPQLFASANHDHMEALRASGHIARAQTFAFNQMVIVAPRDNPSGIADIGDLARAERVVLAGSEVPAGAYSERVLARAGEQRGDDFAERVLSRVVSREMHVRQALHKVVLGEADAAMVYATDAASVGDKVQIIAIPDELNVSASYPIALVGADGSSQPGQPFLDFILSKEGQQKLQSFGFRPGSTALASAHNP